MAHYGLLRQNKKKLFILNQNTRLLLCYSVTIGKYLLAANVLKNFLPSLQSLAVQYSGVPGGNINIMGGHTIGHSKQKTVYVHVFYSERFPSKIKLFH